MVAPDLEQSLNMESFAKTSDTNLYSSSCGGPGKKAASAYAKKRGMEVTKKWKSKKKK